jgi:hypothetical protein
MDNQRYKLVLLASMENKYLCRLVRQTGTDTQKLSMRWIIFVVFIARSSCLRTNTNILFISVLVFWMII